MLVFRFFFLTAPVEKANLALTNLASAAHWQSLADALSVFLGLVDVRWYRLLGIPWDEERGVAAVWIVKDEVGVVCGKDGGTQPPWKTPERFPLSHKLDYGSEINSEPPLRQQFPKRGFELGEL